MQNSRGNGGKLLGIGKEGEAIIVGDAQSFMKLRMRGMKADISVMIDIRHNKMHNEMTRLKEDGGVLNIGLHGRDGVSLGLSSHPRKKVKGTCRSLLPTQASLPQGMAGAPWIEGSQTRDSIPLDPLGEGIYC